MTFHLHGILQNERLAVSRALSFVENSSDLNLELTDALFPHLGKSYRVGITGPPGAGKSSLVDRLIGAWRAEEKKVAVISVDPTSPFTGGAILGDRVRMNRHYADKGVFIRSMATRGSHGGLALKAQEAADIFDAAGYEIILFETVGVGQVELDVARAADTTLVVLVPESGDDIQAMKAGLMEIADIFVVNKGDRDGANQAVVQIQSMLEMRHHHGGSWSPQVVKTSALQDQGIDVLLGTLQEHHAQLSANKGLRENLNRRMQERLQNHISHGLIQSFWTEDKLNTLHQLDASRADGLKPGEILKALKK